MSDVKDRSQEKALEPVVPEPKEFGQVANDLCQKALNDAKEQLHPLLRDADLDRLDRRDEFVQAFKSALELRIARNLAAWLPGVQAIFKFDETPMETWETWDGSIHLLVKVPRLSHTVKALGEKLDGSLVKYFEALGWSRYKMCQSILEIQQVTPNELRHGISYGAMFCAVYTAPVKVWPQNRLTK